MAEDKNILERARNRAKWKKVSSVLWTVFVFSLLAWAGGFVKGAWKEAGSNPRYADVQAEKNMNRLQIFSVIATSKLHELQSGNTKPEEPVKIAMQPEPPRVRRQEEPAGRVTPREPYRESPSEPPLPEDEPPMPEPDQPQDEPTEPEPPVDTPETVPPFEQPAPPPPPVKLAETKGGIESAIKRANSAFDEAAKWYDLSGPTAPQAGRANASREAMKKLKEAQQMHLDLLDSKKLPENARAHISDRLQAIQKMMYWTGKLGRN